MRQESVARVVDDAGRAESPLVLGHQEVDGTAELVRAAQRIDVGGEQAASRRTNARRRWSRQAKSTDGPPVLKGAVMADDDFHAGSVSRF